MKRWLLLLNSSIVLAWFLFPGLIAVQLAAPKEAHAQGKIKVAVLGKMAKGESARRLAYLYPTLTANLQEAFLRDGRFDLVPEGELDRALANPGKSRQKIDPDNAAQLREIGKRVGAELVFVSYYFEMGCHAGTRAENVLTLVAVGSERMETIDKTYGRELSDKDLATSDATILEELLKNAGPLLAAR
jgi:hypothetical protein